MCNIVLKSGKPCGGKGSPLCGVHARSAQKKQSESDLHDDIIITPQLSTSSDISDSYTTMCQHQDSTAIGAPVSAPTTKPLDLFEAIFDIKTGGPNLDGLKTIEGSFYERFDDNKLAFCINNQTEIESHFRPEAQNSLPLSKYYHAAAAGLGECYVEYRQVGFPGRYYALESISAQNMVREVRHTIFNDYYVDMDIDNAHPVFTVWLCNKLSIPCYVMADYVRNRDAHMKELMVANNITRGQAKQIYLSINYGGKRDYNLVKHKTQHLNDYFKEAAAIQKAIFEKLPYFSAYTQKDRAAKGKSYNIAGTCLSHVCAFIENQVLARIVEYLLDQIGYDAVHHSVLCFDGVMIPKGSHEDRFLPELEALFSAMGLPIKLSMKKFEPLDLGTMGYDSTVMYEVERPIDEKKKINKQTRTVGCKPIDILRTELLEICKDRYRRVEQSGAIYERKYDYYYTHKFDAPEPFLTHIFRDNKLYSTSGSSVHKELLYFIKHIVHPDFEFIHHDYNYIGFTNGVYDLSAARFVPTNELDKTIQVRKLFNQEYSIAPTPLLDAYLGFQFHADDIEFIYFMLGRSMTRLDDKFDFMILLYGQGGSGKSLLMKLIMETYAASQLGILSSAFQGIFGLSEFAHRHLVCSDDMPSNLAKILDKGDFLKMITRGSLSCPVKGRGSIEVHDWNIPTIINSNNLPNYKDESGEIVRRVMVINFENVIPTDQCNTSLADNIVDSEISTFIHRCRSTYLKYKQQYAGKNVETFCPKVFLDNRKLLRLAVNNTCAFIHERFEYSEVDADTMTVPQLNKLFKVWMKERYSLQKNSPDNINPQSIESLDARMTYRKVKLCKHCKRDHKKNCCVNYARDDRTSQDRVYNIKKKDCQDDPSECEAFQQR